MTVSSSPTDGGRRNRQAGTVPRVDERSAFEQARLLGHGWVGPEHFLLAVLSTASAASEALAAAGVTYEQVRDHVRSVRHEPDAGPPAGGGRRGVTPNPAAHQLMGWARGYALASGAAGPAPEHWLIALLYEGDRGAMWLHPFGVGAGVVVAALAARGVPVPRSAPPEHRPWRGLRHASVAEDELRPVLDLLRQRHPAGSEWRWGFNRVGGVGGVGDSRQGRISAEAGVDLEAIVAEVRKRTSGPG